MAFPRNILAVLAALILPALCAGPAGAVTFNVNTTVDGADAFPGDGQCTGRTPACSLRGAVQEANALAGADIVNVPPGDFALTLGAIDVTSPLVVVGASARATTVRRAGDGAARVFDVFRNPNVRVPTPPTVTLAAMTIRDGRAHSANGHFGGNIRSTGSDLTVQDSMITGGAGNSAGGIANVRGTLTVRRSTIVANSAPSDPTAGGDAGAILNFGESLTPATLVVENSTIDQNVARLGGGIFSYNDPGNSVTIRSSTITRNSSGDRGGGGGILIVSGSASVANSIVANNSSVTPGQANCSATTSITSLGSNLESATDCGFDSAGDRQSTDPLLAALQNAGGPTDTRPLLPGSQAIDSAAGANCPGTDQRGIARPQGPRCDIGAYELVAAAPATLPDTVIVASPPGLTKDKTPTFAFSSGPGVTFECAVDAGAFAPCSSPFVLPTLAPGMHTFRVRARDAAGRVDPSPASVTFVVLKVLADLPAPVLGKTVNAEPVSGSVLVAGRGVTSVRGPRAAQKGLVFVPLREARQVRIGSFFNTRKGRVRLQGATTRRGARQTGVFYSGLFQTLQSRKKREKGVMELRLTGSSFRGCRTAGHGKKAGAARHSRRRVRRVRGNARGRFRTRGRYSSATVRGTIWEVADRCDGTLTRVTRGKVAVRDFRRRKSVLVRAGKSYLARPRR